MGRPLVIYGTGGMARDALQVVRDLVRAGADWEFVGFLDDDPSRVGTEVQGHPVLGDWQWAAGSAGFSRHDGTDGTDSDPESKIHDPKSKIHVAIGIGSPAAKLRIASRLGASVSWATLVSPYASFGDHNELGVGCILCAGVRVTTDARIGSHVILNLNSTVAHDASLGDYATVNPLTSLSGNVSVDEGAELGTGVSVLPMVSVGAWSVVGAGAVVTSDVAPNSVAVGVPARAIKMRDEGWHL